MAFFSPFSLFDVPVTPRRYCIVKRQPRQPPVSDGLDALLAPFLLGESLRQKPANKPRPKPAKWVECVQLPGFAPREVKAEVKGRKVVIIGRSVEGDDENKNLYKIKRTLVIPADVDASKVTCHYVPRRFVLVEGPRAKKNESSKPAVQPATRVIPIQQTDDQDPMGQQKATDASKTPDDAGDAPTSQESVEGGEEQKGAPETAAATMETSAAQTASEDDKAAPEEDKAASQEGGRSSEESDAASTRAEAGDIVMEVDDEDDSGSDEEHMVNILRGDDQTTTPTDSAAASAVSKTTTLDPPARPAHFELTLNLRGFHPDDVKVSREGRDVVIQAEHVERRGDCSSRQVFSQTVTLPDSVDAAHLRSFLRDDGHLMVTAPYCQAASDVTIPIHVE